MRKAVRAELNHIEALLLKGGEDARHLWDILSALRGPDEKDGPDKNVTTCPVRRRAFPKLARHPARHNVPASFGRRGEVNPRMPVVFMENAVADRRFPTHFERHIRKAAVAIKAPSK